MKIALFTDNQYRGGLDTFLVSLINHWPVPDDQLTVICNRSHPGLPLIESRLTRQCTIVAHRLPGHGRWYHGNTSNAVLRSAVGRLSLSLLRRIAGYPLFLSYVAALATTFRGTRFDRLMVVNGGYPASLSCRAASIAWWVAGKKPGAIHNFHNLAMLSPGLRGPFDHIIDRLVREATSTFISVSRACASSLAVRPAFLHDHVRVIYNGINLPLPSATAAASLRAELGVPAQAPLCLLLASYEVRKGHEFFFRAFRRVIERVPEARAVCCGDGTPEEVETLKELVRQNGLEGRVLLAGFRPDIRPMLEATQVLAIASQEFESFGLVLVEAMAMKKPVVGTRVGGIPEVIGEEAGLLFARDDVEGFADGIVTFMTDTELAKETGESGYERYLAKFTAERMAQEYAELVRS
jgi:glycosyltransferase involved in cell wall biosynthesis